MLYASALAETKALQAYQKSEAMPSGYCLMDYTHPTIYANLNRAKHISHALKDLICESFHCR